MPFMYKSTHWTCVVVLLQALLAQGKRDVNAQKSLEVGDAMLHGQVSDKEHAVRERTDTISIAVGSGSLERLNWKPKFGKKKNKEQQNATRTELEEMEKKPETALVTAAVCEMPCKELWAAHAEAKSRHKKAKVGIAMGGISTLLAVTGASVGAAAAARGLDAVKTMCGFVGASWGSYAHGAHLFSSKIKSTSKSTFHKMKTGIKGIGRKKNKKGTDGKEEGKATALIEKTVPEQEKHDQQSTSGVTVNVTPVQRPTENDAPQEKKSEQEDFKMSETELAQEDEEKHTLLNPNLVESIQKGGGDGHKGQADEKLCRESEEIAVGHINDPHMLQDVEEQILSNQTSPKNKSITGKKAVKDEDNEQMVNAFKNRSASGKVKLSKEDENARDSRELKHKKAAKLSTHLSYGGMALASIGIGCTIAAVAGAAPIAAPIAFALTGASIAIGLAKTSTATAQLHWAKKDVELYQKALCEHCFPNVEISICRTWLDVNDGTELKIEKVEVDPKATLSNAVIEEPEDERIH